MRCFTWLSAFVYSPTSRHFTPPPLLDALYEWCAARAGSSISSYISSNNSSNSTSNSNSSNSNCNLSSRYNLQLNYFGFVSWLVLCWFWILFSVWFWLWLPLLHGSLAGTCRQWLNAAVAPAQLTDLKILANRFEPHSHKKLLNFSLFDLEKCYSWFIWTGVYKGDRISFIWYQEIPQRVLTTLIFIGINI